MVKSDLRAKSDEELMESYKMGSRIPTPSRAARIAKKLGLPEMGMIQLALRDSLAKEGFKYEVRLESA